MHLQLSQALLKGSICLHRDLLQLSQLARALLCQLAGLLQLVLQRMRPARIPALGCPALGSLI